MSFRRSKPSFYRRFLRSFPVLFLFLFQAGCSGSVEYEARLLSALRAKDYESLKNFDIQAGKISRTFGDSAPYFFGLHSLAAGRVDQAIKLFSLGAKSSNAYAAFSSVQMLAETGTVPQRLAAVRAAIEQTPDDLLLRAELAGFLYDSGDFAAALTEAALPSIAEFSLGTVHTPDYRGKFFENRQAAGASKRTRMALLSLLQLKNKDFMAYARAWFLHYPVGAEHLEFYERLPPKEELVVLFGPEYESLASLMSLRLAVFGRKYSQAFSYAGLPEFDFPGADGANSGTAAAPTESAAALPVESAATAASSAEPSAVVPLFLEPQVLSDLGRAYLYGAAAKRLGAARFEQLGKNVTDARLRFLAWFYAGRLYSLSGAFDKARPCFEQAIAAAPLPENYDNALWYYLDLIVKEYPAEICPLLELYSPLWKDSAYFQDLLDYTAYVLVSGRRWADLVRVGISISAYADGETRAKYSYITARLLQEGLIKNPESDQTDEETANRLLREAFEGDHSNLYYRFLSAESLEIPVEDVFFSVLKRREKPDFVEDREFSAFLLDHARFGFPEEVYALYRENPDGVSIRTAERLSAEIALYGGEFPRMYSDSLRVIALGVSRVDAPITREILELLYPRPYIDFIAAACERFYVPEYILYGLVRSESFFDKDIISHAGAIGLAQLMRPTAADIASRLKLKDYDLLDAKTNVEFGAYYYSYLLDRLEYSPLLALFAYNGGMGRVRSWVKAASGLPPDLFLEAIPFSETREYGRKVLASAALYGYLYYEKTPLEIADEIMK